jgi:hypothetical protein
MFFFSSGGDILFTGLLTHLSLSIIADQSGRLQQKYSMLSDLLKLFIACL